MQIHFIWVAYLPLWIGISDLYDQAGTMTLHQSLLLWRFILQTFVKGKSKFILVLHFINLCVIFDTFLIYAYSTLFRCFQIICNDSLLLFSSKSNKPTHVQSGGYISLSLDSMVCQFVRFFKVIHDQYWKKIVLYIPVSELRLIYSCKIEQTLWSQ